MDIPLRRAFVHAAAERRSVERVIVVISDDAGRRGIGEILPRPYLTGEDVARMFDVAAPRHAARLVGRCFTDWEQIVGAISEALDSELEGPALLGGFEAALINLGEQALSPFDYDAILGPPRRNEPGRCATIGRPNSETNLKRVAFETRLSGADIVKIKVANADDAVFVRRLAELLGELPIRLDANGSLSYDDARNLLAQLHDLPIDSLEQPMNRDASDLRGQLEALEAEYGVLLMADESVCSWRDAAIWARQPGYRIFNVRVGKHGGLFGAKRVIEAARVGGKQIVGGTLVGESTVLDRYGNILLNHTPDMPYMEGLGQAKWLLEVNPFEEEIISIEDPEIEPVVRFSVPIEAALAYMTTETKVID